MKKLIRTTVILSLLTMSAYGASVDLKTSKFDWKGTKITGQHVGNLSLKSAKVELSDKGHFEKGEFEIDMNSLTVTDLEGEWAQKFLTHMKSKDFFEVNKFPSAKLKVNRVEKGHLVGDLTIKGKTNPVLIPFSQSDKGIKGTMKFDRTKFDMIYGSGSFFKGLGDKTIHNEVILNFDVVIKK